MPPDAWILYKEEIRDKADFLTLVEQKVSLPRVPNGRAVNVPCPWHNEQKGKSLAVYSDHAHCFGACNQTWDVFGWAMQMWGVDFAEARDRLAELYHVPKPEMTPEAREAARVRRQEQELLSLAADYYQDRLWSKAGAAVLEYARDRWANNDEMIEAHSLGASGGLGAHLRAISADLETARRLGLLNANGHDFIPPGFLVYPHRRGGQVEYLSARSIKGKTHRNLPTLKQPFFNALYTPRVPAVLIVEGQACAISAAMLDMPAVALAGCSLDDELKDRLTRHDRLIVCLDTNRTGRNAARNVAQALGPLTQVITLPDDVDDLDDWRQQRMGTAEALVKMVEEAPTWLDIRLDEVGAMNPLQRDRAMPGLFALLARLDDWTLPRYRAKVCQQFKISQGDFKTYLAKVEEGGEDDLEFLTGTRYTVRENCLCRWLPDGGQEALCNFVAEVSEEVVEDDGQDTIRKLVVDGTLRDGRKLPTAIVPASKFDGLGWIVEHWGISPNIYAGSRTKLHVRAAIGQLSYNAPSRWVYTHTGWRNIEGEWCYLSHTGAIGKRGIEVDMGKQELQLYALPLEPVNLVEAVQTSLDFLETGPYHVTIPLWAAMYLAPLSSIKEPDFVLWLYGTTGSLKSSLASLALAHFGPRFAYNRMPANWEDTESKLEKKAFQVKDAPLCVDDFAPQSTAAGAAHLERKAARVLRNFANRTGRGRLRSDLSDRTTYAPRGLVMATGEQLPAGHSIIGRLFAVQMEPGMVNLEHDILPRVAVQGRYSHAMSGYIAWLAARYQTLAETLPDRFLDKLNSIPVEASHLRVNSAVACLYLGLELALEFACEVQAIQPGQAEELRQLGWSSLLYIGKEQSQLVIEEKPTERFIEVLKTLLAQERYYLEDKDGVRPATGAGAGAKLLGWYDADFLYLMSTATYNAVAEFCRQEGGYFPLKQKQLYKMLAEEGLLIPGADKATRPFRFGNQQHRVIVLVKNKVYEGEEIC